MDMSGNSKLLSASLLAAFTVVFDNAEHVLKFAQWKLLRCPFCDHNLPHAHGKGMMEVISGSSAYC
jgi:hypothetical protein